MILLILLGYGQSPFRVFGGYLRNLVGLDEKSIQLFLKHNFSYFLTYEIPRGIHLNKDISEIVYTMGDHERTLQTEYDDISKKTKILLTRFGLTIGTLGYDEKSFFKTFLGFTPYWK